MKIVLLLVAAGIFSVVVLLRLIKSYQDGQETDDWVDSTTKLSRVIRVAIRLIAVVIALIFALSMIWEKI